MAAEADYGTADPEKGIYGIYNDFYIRITTTVDKFKLKFRIRITFPNEPAFIVPEREINPIADVSIVNPMEILKDTFFRCQLLGLNGNVLDDRLTNDVANRGINLVNIKIGESYSDTADTPATFRGYDTDHTFAFYNGYENIAISDTTIAYSNYRNVGWYNATTIKLPHTILNRRVINAVELQVGGSGDINKIFMPNVIERSDGSYRLTSLVIDSFDADGTPTGQDIEAVSLGVTLTGYHVFRSVNSGGKDGSYEEFYGRYQLNGAGANVLTQKIRFTYLPMEKFRRHRLRWFNRYGAFEYLDFIGSLETTQEVTQGKMIQSDGVDVEAASFDDIKTISRPEMRSYGKTSKQRFTLHSGWLNIEEQEALKDLFKSPNVIMYTPNNNIVPVIVTNNSFKITDIQVDLIKVAIEMELANADKIQIQ